MAAPRVCKRQTWLAIIFWFWPIILVYLVDKNSGLVCKDNKTISFGIFVFDNTAIF
jgi:hypothetical protein